MGVENQTLKPKNEELIKQLGLVAGKEITIKNVDTSPDTKDQLNKSLGGKLKNDVREGFPIEFENGLITKNVRNIGVQTGKYFIQTTDSLYELKA